MRNSILFFLASFLVFLCSPAAAQPGVKLGLSVSDIVFADDGTAAYLGYEADFLDHRLPYLSLQGGLFADFELSKRFNLQPELLLVRRGLDYKSEYLYDDITFRVKIHYLHVPLLLKYKLNVAEGGYSALYSGPYASWQLAARHQKEIEGNQVDEEMDAVHSTDWGITLGYEKGFLLQGGKITAEIRTSYSLSDMMDTVDGYLPEYQKPKTRRARNVSITLMAGYRFDNLKTKSP